MNRVECTAKHDLKEWKRYDYTSEMLEVYPLISNKTPHSIWAKYCTDCNYIETHRVEFEADLPAHLKESL